MDAQRLRALFRQVERRIAPAQCVGRGIGRGVDQNRQHERLGVPERVAVVARPGQALGRDAATLAARARLQDVEQPEPRGLLNLVVTHDLDVGAVPELVEVGALFGKQLLEARESRHRDRAGDLVAQRLLAAHVRPAPADVLAERQLLAGLQ